MCANDNAFRDVLPSLRCDVESLVFRRVASYEPFEGLFLSKYFWSRWVGDSPAASIDRPSECRIII
jgi:hypothetical protein